MHDVLRVLAARAQAASPDQTTFPMDFAAVLASPTEFHPLATDAATGQSTDLGPFVGDAAELRLALRASAALPLLAGPPVEFAGRRLAEYQSASPAPPSAAVFSIRPPAHPW